MAYSTVQINEILAKTDRTMYKIGSIAYQNMFSELDEALDYHRDIIYIYKKAVEWGDDYFVGTEKLDKIVERLAGMIAVWDYGMLTPIYTDVSGVEISALPPCLFLVDLCDVNITNVHDGQYLTYDEETGRWINTGPGAAIRYSESITATAGQTVFVTTTPFVNGLFDLYLNGVRLNSASYSTFGSYSITLVDASVAGDILDITIYDNNASVSSLLSLTTTGSTGAATLTGTVLNVPNYGLESISSAAVTGTSTKTLTLTKLGGGTVAASWTDLGAGSGTTNYVAKWATSTTLGNSLIYDNGTNVLINKTSDNSFGRLQVNGGSYFTGNMYIETSANPTQFMLRGTNPEFWFDGAYGGGTSRILINRASTGNQSAVVFTTGAPITKGVAWDGGNGNWAMGITNNNDPNAFKFGVGDIYNPSSVMLTFTTDQVATFKNTPYVGTYYIYHQGNLTLSTLGGVPTTRTLTINGTTYDLSSDRTWSVGTVTSVAALTLGTSGTDLSSTVVTGTTTPVITLNVPTASATNRGALSSFDWTTFNGKQDVITLTTIGTSGPATFIGNVLNVPQYEAEGNYVLTSTTLTINGTTYDLSANRSWSVGTVTSVGLSMPSAFTVTNSPITSSGVIAVTGAGTATQYIRGDGQLATFPSNAGGGSSVSYYLNGSIPSSVVGYQQMDNNAVIGGGTDFTLVGNGLIAQFLTDVGNPNRIQIPGGAWNFEMYFQGSSAGGNQKFYIELHKYNGSTFTLIASSVLIPEEITGGTSIDLYLTSLAVPTTTLLTTDRLAVRVYIVDNAVGRTITLHTENTTLCEIITTFAGGIASLNGLTANTQYLAVGTSGTDFNINSLVDTHTFNLPTASATNRGALSSADWSTFNSKVDGTGVNGQVAYWSGTNTQTGSNNLFWDNTNSRLGIGTNAPSKSLDVRGSINLITPSVASTRENLLTAYVSDNATDVFGIANATIIDARFSPVFYQYSNGSYGSMFFRGLTSTAADTGTVPLIQIQNAITSSTTDPNGVAAFTAVTTRPLLALLNNNTIYLQAFANGNIAINSTTDAGFRLDVNGTGRFSGALTVTGSTTAASAIARGANFTPTLVAAANNDVLVGLDIQPTFTLGGFTGTTILAARFQDNILVSKNENSSRTLTISNTTSGSQSESRIYLLTDSVSGHAAFGKYSNGVAAYKIINGADTYLANGNVKGDLAIFNDFATGKIKFAAGGVSTAQMTLTAAGRLLLGTVSEGTFLLDVNGTSKFQDNLLVSKNQNGGTTINISNTTSGTNSESSFGAISDATSGSFSMGKYSTTTTTYKTIAAKDGYIYNGTAGDISIINDFATGKIKFAAGGVSTAQMTLTAAGRLLLGTTTESTFLLDVNGDSRINTLRIGRGNNNQANNTCIGFNTLNSITTGQQHTAIGSGALQSQTTSFSSIAIGYLAGNAITTSGFNTIVGTQAMQSGNGANNTVIGSSAGATNSGSSNTFVGNSVGKNITGSFNIGLGATNFTNVSANSGTYNIAIGQDIMTGVVSGTGNTAIQYASLGLITSGSYNVAIGRFTGNNITTGANNTLIGDKSGLGLTTASFNTFVGSLFNTVTGNGITTGSFNTIIGSQISGLSTTLANNIILSDGSGNMRLVIDNNGNSFFGGTTAYPTINASSIVQIDSTTKGFLPPRMTTTQRNAIATPAVGLVVYCTDSVEGLYVYTSIGWKSLTMV